MGMTQSQAREKGKTKAKGKNEDTGNKSHEDHPLKGNRNKVFLSLMPVNGLSPIIDICNIWDYIKSKF